MRSELKKRAIAGARPSKERPHDVPEVCPECGEPTTDFNVLYDGDNNHVAGAWSCGCSRAIGAVMRDATAKLQRGG